MQCISPQELYDLLKSRTPVTLLDVRSQDAFSRWSIADSVSIPLDTLPDRLAELSKKTDIVTICEHGIDAQKATKFLLHEGYHVKTLEGGLQGWDSVYDCVPVRLGKTSPIAVYQFKRLGKGCLSYAVITLYDNGVVFVDPSHHLAVYENFITTYDVTPKAVLDTHLHADHVSGAHELAKKLSIPYLLPKESVASVPHEALEPLLPSLFPDDMVTFIHTPGHTPESTAILLADTVLFTGDTLLIDTVGRADLTDAGPHAARNLYESVMQKLIVLPDGITVLPAHASNGMVPGLARTATMRYIKKFNDIITVPTADDFERIQGQNQPDAPPNTNEIKKMNRTGVYSAHRADDLEFGANNCSSRIPVKEDDIPEPIKPEAKHQTSFPSFLPFKPA